MQAVVFPDIAKLWAAGDFTAFRRVVQQTEVLLAALCVVGLIIVQVAAEPMVRLFVGEAFAPAALLLEIQIVAVVFLLCGSTSRAALLCMGKEKTILALSIAATIAFFIIASALLPRIGAAGANIAHVVEGLIVVSGLWLAFRMTLARARSGKLAPRTSAPQPDAGEFE
ncbi:MAG: hypothetical protein HC850_18600 [Rhodomicrobium sp.]|nr:hypothetical protein [Rhodomicrobium sp.]